MNTTAPSPYRPPAGPLKWHGGKHYLARRLVALMPPHTHYVEPFAGGLAVLLAKDPEGTSEVANDLDGRLVNFWRVLRDPDTFERFRRQAEAIPFSEREWQDARVNLEGELAGGADPVEQAVAFFILCRLSLAGRMDSFAPITRRRTRRGMNEQASAWTSAVDGLSAVHARLRRVALLDRPALEVIRSQDGPATLFYCDPPYPHDTRSCPDVYGQEMGEADHRQLLDLLKRCKGKVMLSGYPSELYDRELAGWRRVTFDLPNHSASGASKVRKTEVVWLNYPEG